MRRRFLRAGALVLTAVTVGGVVALVPEKHARAPEQAVGAPQQSVAMEHTIPLTQADRRAISGVLGRFVPSAVNRGRTAASYDLATPNLREGMSRSAWASGNIPVYPYPVRGRRFHDWTLVYSYPRDVSLDLMLQPRRGKKVGPITFAVELKRLRGSWRVDSFFPAAVFSPAGTKPVVLAAKDFTPNPQNSIPKRQLGHLWIALPVAVFCLVLLLPLTLFLVHWQRDLSAMRRYRRELRGTERDRLPSLSNFGR
jgi:hypothetical protein